jgi:hypothetical protein
VYKPKEQTVGSRRSLLLPKSRPPKRVVRVEGALDGLMYVGRPDHLMYLTQLEYKAIYRQTSYNR